MIRTLEPVDPEHAQPVVHKAEPGNFPADGVVHAVAVSEGKDELLPAAWEVTPEVNRQEWCEPPVP
jgi:hypothetical protein